MKSALHRDIHSCVFIEALFTKAKKLKQPKCPSLDKEIVVYTCSGILFSFENRFCM
jgi:hypothetical protein